MSPILQREHHCLLPRLLATQAASLKVGKTQVMRDRLRSSNPSDFYNEGITIDSQIATMDATWDTGGDARHLFVRVHVMMILQTFAPYTLYHTEFSGRHRKPKPIHGQRHEEYEHSCICKCLHAHLRTSNGHAHDHTMHRVWRQHQL